MNRIWSPWRMEFIEGIEKYKGCLFCDLPKEKDTRKSLVLKRGEVSYIVLNKYPYTSGHLMVIPYRHIAKISELNSEESVEIIKFAGDGTKALERACKAEGFNAGFNEGRVAGAGFDKHIHFHVVPRWNGDHNFFPVIGNTRSMPEYLEETYDRLKGEF